ncbi:hypothetical protein [Vibrio alginolyticus]|uniref:hypothetical protein n=1 Tax=Vibrio alginolyticus TaxID=663 RepID=UPI0006CA9AA3|nr:hypothetical protein [Vibrio alginolyticus]KPM98517.1 hypothetical protein AOG25_08720 [Vibrio alginolyticus]CAH7147656.1 conserved exported hypothetical protein [Vibrio chagasii]CAH7318546.1 conserved exported hypothetical protein [Vibrio chagasii]
MLKKTLLAATASLALSGCAATSDIEPVKVDVSQVDYSERALVKAWDRLAESAAISAEANLNLSKLANGQAAQHMDESDYMEFVFQSSYVPEGMEIEVDNLDYEGNALSLLALIADMSGYTVVLPEYETFVEPHVKINTESKYGSKIKNAKDVYDVIDRTNKDLLDMKIIEDSRLIIVNYLI